LQPSIDSGATATRGVRWALVALALASVAATEPELVDRVVAVIEDEVITLRELEAKAKPYLAQLDEVGDTQKRAARREEILHQVLDIEIGERMVNGAIKNSAERIGVTDQDVDKAVQDVLKMNNLTEKELEAALYAQSMTWKEYRDKLRDQLERARLIQMEVQPRIQLRDGDVERLCRERERSGATGVEVCASHVLVGVPKDATKEQTEALYARATQLQAELAAGADFPAYAMRYSDDKGAPDGRLGCFRKGEMLEVFEDTAFGLEVGGVSKVVRTPLGFHIIKVTDRRVPASGCATDEELAPFRNELYQEEFEKQMNAWVAELRKKSFVEVRL